MIRRNVENLRMLPSRMMGGFLAQTPNVDSALRNYRRIPEDPKAAGEMIMDLPNDLTDAVAHSLGLKYKHIRMFADQRGYEITAPRRTSFLGRHFLPRQIVAALTASDHYDAFRQTFIELRPGRFQISPEKPATTPKEYNINIPGRGLYRGVVAESEEAARERALGLPYGADIEPASLRPDPKKSHDKPPLRLIKDEETVQENGKTA